METEQKVKYDIETNGVVATVTFSPKSMTPYHYIKLAQEIKEFYHVFWDNNGEVNWLDCLEPDEIEEYVNSFFGDTEFINEKNKERV